MKKAEPSRVRLLSYQPACKPGSVWGPPFSKTPRRPFIWDACCHAPQAINPGGGPEDGLDVAGFPVCAAHKEKRTSGHPYLILLPVGFALPRLLPDARCALTAPFHPYSPSPCGFRRSSPLRACHAEAAFAAKAGGLFSVALSLGSPPAAVNRHRFFKEPGLSSTGCLLGPL